MGTWLMTHVRVRLRWPVRSQVVLLWIHESERIYGDRLVSPQDLKKYRALAADLSKKMFGDLVMILDGRKPMVNVYD